MNKICYGCGAHLQSIDKDKIGYIPANKEDASYCMRCYKLKHYGINNEIKTPKKIDEIIYLVNQDKKHTIFLVDFVSISDEVINIFKRISGPKLLLISKLDMLPKDIKLEKIKNYLYNRYNINEKNIKFISSLSNNKVNELINYLIRNNIDKTYILGLSNSGKSTLINKIIDLTNSKVNKIVTSHNKNTTLDFIRLPLSNGITLIDSPGFIINSYNIESKEKTKIKPLTYQIKEGDTLRINDIYLKFSNKTNITIYSNYNLDTKKYYKENISYNSKLNIDNNSDLIIKGLCFINIKDKTDIEIDFNKNITEVRESIFR